MTPEKELLAKAAEIMAEQGQAKTTYRVVWDSPLGRAGSVCAYGAMTLAATEGETAQYAELPLEAPAVKGLIEQAATLLARQIDPHVPADKTAAFRVITLFNDAKKTTAEDVILAMKKAAHTE